MNIPDEAVEAAARAIFESPTFGHRSRDWDALERRHHFEQARRALEVAAPHMLMAAYEQGWDDAIDGVRSEEWRRK